jgi:hypothetical protein
MYGMQVKNYLTDQWVWVHPTNGEPYRYATEKEAQHMLEVCYPMENSKTVRVRPFPGVANAGA